MFEINIGDIVEDIISLASIIFWIGYFIYSCWNDDTAHDSDSTYQEDNELDFWDKYAIFMCISDKIDEIYYEAEQQALQDDPDSVHYNIY